MNRLTAEKRLQIVEIYFQNQSSVKHIFRVLPPFYGVHNRPTERTIRGTINKLRSIHAEKCAIWRGLWAGGIIGPYFFKNAEGVCVTVNGVRYRAMINEFLFPKIQDISVADLWFQQDCATCHTAGEIIDLLKEHVIFYILFTSLLSESEVSDMSF